MSTEKSQSSCNMIPEEQESTTRFVQNISFNFFDIANAAGKFAKNPRSKIALDNFFERLKALEKEWYEFGVKFEQMQRQNENLYHECERERNKSKVYQKRLKFVKDNQENFERLRDVYINLKSSNRESFQKGVQTETRRNSSDASVLTDYLPVLVSNAKTGLVTVGKDTIDGAKVAFTRIKQLVTARENRLDESMQQISKLNANVYILEEENKRLTEILMQKYAAEYDNDVEMSEDAFKMETGQDINRIRNSGRNSYRPKCIDTQTCTYYDNSDLDDQKDQHIPMKTIKSIKSMITSSISLNQLAKDSRADIYAPLPMSKHDLKEVEVLKKIQKEISKRQNYINEMVDDFYDSG